MKVQQKILLIIIPNILLGISALAQDSTKAVFENSRNVSTNYGLSIYGGATIPAGDFSDPNICAAKTGFTFGAQFVTGLGFLLDASYTTNPTYIVNTIEAMGGEGTSSNWKSLLVLSGFKFGKIRENKPSFFFAPVLGAVFISSPSVEYSITETYPSLVYTTKYSTASVSSSALAYGVMIELDTKRISLGARYIASSPTFHYSTQRSTSTGIQITDQGSSQRDIKFIQILLAVLF